LFASDADGVFEEAERAILLGPAEIAVAVMGHQDGGSRGADLAGRLEFPVATAAAAARARLGPDPFP